MAWLACGAIAGCASTGETPAPGDGGAVEAALPEAGELDAAGRTHDRRRMHDAMDGGSEDASNDAAPPGEAGPEAGRVDVEGGTDGDAATDAAVDATDAAPLLDVRTKAVADVQSRFVTFRTQPSIGPQWHSLEFEPRAVLCFGAPVTGELPQKGSGGFVALSDGVTTVGIADAMTDDDTVSSRAIDVEQAIIIRAGTQEPVVRFTVHLAEDGFELQYTLTDGEAYALGCLVLGGADVEAAVVPVATQTGEVRGLPLTPELIFAITPGDGDQVGGNAGDDHPLNSFGVCDATSLSQWWFGMYSDDRADGKRAHVVQGKLLGEPMFWNSAVTQTFEDGFAWEAAGGDDTAAFLVVNVAGVPLHVGLMHAESDATGPVQQALDDLGFQPQAMGFVSAAREVLTGIGPTDRSHAAQSMGMVDSQLHQANLARFTEFGADNADQRWTEGKAIGIPALDAHHGALGEVVAMDDSTPTIGWATGDGKRYRIGYFALGVP